LQFLFIYFLFKIFKKTINHPINQNPCIQHDAQSLGISKLINYHFIYIKGKFNYSNSLTRRNKILIVASKF
jgi:hypothetical protein